MIQFITVLLLFSAFETGPQPVVASPEADSSYETRLQTGIEAFYQTDWNRAISIFDDLKKEAPDDPRPYFFESMMPFWEYFFIEQREELASEFLEISEIAVNLSEKKLENSPNDTTTVLLLSGLHGYRSLVAAGEQEYRIALNSGMTGFNYTRKLFALQSDMPSAQIGRGMFYYMAGSVPKEVRWLTNAVGIRGDVEMGFEELKKAAESDNPVSSDAKLMLVYLSDKEGMDQQALHYAGQLTDEYPENVIFLYKEAQIHEKTGNTEQAEALYEKIISLDNQALKALSNLSQKRLDEIRSS